MELFQQKEKKDLHHQGASKYLKDNAARTDGR
jgi:hypothetical protein